MCALEKTHALEGHGAEAVLDALLAGRPESGACITCSFQAEDVVVLHLLRERVPDVPVLFLDTGYHFAETYEYRDRMTQEWSLNLVNVLPEKTIEQQESEFGILYREQPTKCCQLRKVEPLMRSLEPFDIWFTGLRREQSPTRKNLKKVEQHRSGTAADCWTSGRRSCRDGICFRGRAAIDCRSVLFARPACKLSLLPSPVDWRCARPCAGYVRAACHL